MKVLQKALIPNGSAQIEDWSKDYTCFSYGSLVVVYTKSKANIEGQFSPKFNQNYRFEFKFSNHEEATKALNGLISGSKKVKDFKNNLWIPAYSDCI